MRRRFWIMAIVAIAACGCASDAPLPIWGPPPGWVAAPPVVPQNPLRVPIADGNYVFDQAVDVVDDYFRIEREDRVRQVGSIVTEGRIETFYTTSPTVLEPWEADSATLFDRVENTLQSMRRKATVRVIPTQGGFLVDVAVIKELEDVPPPSKGAKGLATFQHGTTLDRGEDAASNQLATKGWISKGRDPALELDMLSALQIRLAEAGAATTRPLR